MSQTIANKDLSSLNSLVLDEVKKKISLIRIKRSGASQHTIQHVGRMKMVIGVFFVVIIVAAFLLDIHIPMLL